MNEETLLITFKTICNFISDLSEEYGNRHKPLKLYNRLISHTKISHDQAIQKHISTFTDFCVKNRDALYLQDKTKLLSNKIEYNERVFIDMGFILSIADAETASVIWKHLLTISAFVDQAGKAKEILRKMVEDNKAPIESNFLTDIISKVESNVKPDAGPAEAIQSLLQSGVFTDLFSGMQSGMKSGKLDLGKMIGAVQEMVSKMSEKAKDPESKKSAEMLQNMTSMLGNVGQGGQPPDLSGMMGMMQTMMSGLMVGGLNTAHEPTVEETVNAKVEEIKENSNN
jgi:hypothetical protein